MAFWDGVHWLHLLAMAFFVGGQLFLVACVVPVLRADPDRTRIRAVARRFGYGTLAAIAVLVATGVALAGHEQRWDDATLHVKLTLVAVVGVLVGWHTQRPGDHVLEGLIFVASLAIVWLGVALAQG